MASRLSIVRGWIYVIVLLFTFICFGIACNFQVVLWPSDLICFVPFALCTCSASIFIFISLLACSCFGRRNPISTWTELAYLALAGFNWLALGVFLANNDSQLEAEAEYFVTIFDPGQYQDMYRVIMTFSLMNAIIILSYVFVLLIILVNRRHRNDDMWHKPLTSNA